MKSLAVKVCAIALFIGIFSFQYLGILSHSFVHALEIEHGSHADHKDQHDDSNGHPDADLKDSFYGIIQTSLFKICLEPVILFLKIVPNSDVDSRNKFYLRTGQSPPDLADPSLQLYFTHAPPALF